MMYGIPIAGTMAHSYIQAHESEEEAFRRFSDLYPETILLVDTYDTLEGVRRVTHLAKERGELFRVRGVRLDSGDLGELARQSRKILDEAGLDSVTIFASGSLDEHEIARLVLEAPSIRGFGVGTNMGVSSDAPALDMAYKITSYAGSGRLKLSKGKGILPGDKQVFRFEQNGLAVKDVIARRDERLNGRPLLREVMAAGRRVAELPAGLESLRSHFREEIARLPSEVRSLQPLRPRYPVNMSDELRRYRDEVARRVCVGSESEESE
jgi:nicotinate phosphoribosyltransferase